MVSFLATSASFCGYVGLYHNIIQYFQCNSHFPLPDHRSVATISSPMSIAGPEKAKA